MTFHIPTEAGSSPRIRVAMGQEAIAEITLLLPRVDLTALERHAEASRLTVGQLLRVSIRRTSELDGDGISRPRKGSAGAC